MTYMNILIDEYSKMGNAFSYTSHRDIPKRILEIIDDYADARNIFKIPLTNINEFLTSIYNEMVEHG